MATISGKNGKVEIGSTVLASITNWSLTQTSNNDSYASSATSGCKSRVAGVKDASGTIEIVLDLADPIYDDFTPGSAVTLDLFLDGTEYFIVPAIIDSMSISADIDNGTATRVTAAFSATGAITLPNFA